MKKNDILKLKDKDNLELQKELSEAQEELRSLKFDINSGKVKNYKSLQEVRRKIARILTFLKAKQ